MKLNLIDSILMSLMLVFLMIGGHQTYVVGQTEGWSMGFYKSYWIFMLMMGCMLILNFRRNRALKKEQQDQKKKKSKIVKPGKNKQKR
jgi:hypothetical protein